MWMSNGVGGSPLLDKKFLNVNIINFEKVDKPDRPSKCNFFAQANFLMDNFAHGNWHKMP